MKRIAFIIGVVIGVAAMPTVVAASDSGGKSGDRYKLAHTSNTRLGPVYGPIKVAPSTYAFMSK